MAKSNYTTNHLTYIVHLNVCHFHTLKYQICANSTYYIPWLIILVGEIIMTVYYS